MRRIWIFAVALVLTSQAQPLHAATQTWFGFQVGVNGGSAPPPPVVWRSEPRVIVVDDVQVVDDDHCGDDVFRSDNMWWRLSGGYWYRSASWHGPWMGVDVRRVPERVLVVPASHWKHHPRHNARRVFANRDDDDDHDHCRRERERGRRHHDHDDD